MKKTFETKIQDDDFVIVTKMNKVTEVKTVNYIVNNAPKIKRISKTQFVQTDTGVVIDYNTPTFGSDKGCGGSGNKTSTRLSNTESLSKTRRHMKELIITNYDSSDKSQIITLTFDDFVSDIETFDRKFQSFMKAIRREFCKEKSNTVKYIASVEFDHNKRIHAHVILYWKKPFPVNIKNALTDLRSKNGSLYYDSIQDTVQITKIAAYLTNHLSSHFDITASKSEISVIPGEKSAIKHARLDNFAAYQHNFRHSEGMKKPSKKYMYYSEASKKLDPDDCFYAADCDKKIEKNFSVHQEYEYYNN